MGGALGVDNVALKAILLILLITVTFIVGFVMAPGGLAPIILSTTGRALGTRLSVRDMRLAFFSAFPRFKLGIGGNDLISGTLGSDD